MFRTSALLLLAIVFVFAATNTSAATFNVNTTNDTVDATPGDGNCADAGAQCSLRAAITEANALAGADIINVPAGTYTQSLVAADENLNAGGDWDITTDITLNGAGSATTILQANAAPNVATERVMEIASSAAIVSISGATLRHGNKTGAAAAITRGGGIRNTGTLTFSDSIVTLNNASGGGGIRNERTITLNNVTVSSNACNTAGGSCFGGGMYNTLAALSTVTITNSTFTGNSSTSTLADAFGFAGGFGIESATGFNLVVTGSTFSNNTGVGNGAGGSGGNGLRMLASAASTANITSSTFSGNSGTGGSSHQGPGMTVFTTATGTLSGTWDRVNVTGNIGTAAGGILLNSTGGAMTITLQNSTISGNSGAGFAGGLIASNSGATSGAANVLNIINSTISGNQTGGAGGGLFVESPATTGSFSANLNFVTITNNVANSDNTGIESGGGIFRGGTLNTFNLKNSVVSGNLLGTGGTAPDVAGAVTSQDYNHIGNLTGATITGSTANNTTGNAQLGPLANNGGSTQTHLPSAGSPVVNQIPNSVNDCGTTIVLDQRGLPRPVLGSCDKGSVEVAGAAPTTATISGRVTTAGGRPIANAYFLLTGGAIVTPMTVRSSSFGYFSIPNLAIGASYTLTLQPMKQYTFASSSQVIVLNADVTNANFVANP